jgi:hypothetical protein
MNDDKREKATPAQPTFEETLYVPSNHRGPTVNPECGCPVVRRPNEAFAEGYTYEPIPQF